MKESVLFSLDGRTRISRMIDGRHQVISTISHLFAPLLFLSNRWKTELRSLRLSLFILPTGYLNQDDSPSKKQSIWNRFISLRIWLTMMCLMGIEFFTRDQMPTWYILRIVSFFLLSLFAWGNDIDVFESFRIDAQQLHCFSDSDSQFSMEFSR